MSTPDVHALTGAYVMNAVPEFERAAFERHLKECDACAQEVRELRETAARLGQAAAAVPPPYLKSQVFSRINQVRQVPASGSLPEPARGTSRLAMRMMTIAAAVLLLATATLAVLLVQQQNKLDDSRQIASEISEILRAGDVKPVSKQSDRGGTGTVLISERQNRALLITTGMPDPGGGKVYQAWYQNADETFRSAGLMPAATVAQTTLLELNGLGSSKGIGLSLEPSGGSPQPTDVVMLLNLQA